MMKHLMLTGSQIVDGCSFFFKYVFLNRGWSPEEVHSWTTNEKALEVVQELYFCFMIFLPVFESSMEHDYYNVCCKEYSM